MVPDPCGDAFAAAVAAGADPDFVVPDDYMVVRGGGSPMPPAGQTFFGAIGPTLKAAAAAVPHGSIRVVETAARRNPCARRQGDLGAGNLSAPDNQQPTR